MQRLEFIRKNRLEWRDVPTPMISEVNQAIVRPLAVSRCDLDLPMFRGETLFRPPFPIGHEFIGEILHVSEDLYNSYSMGDRVVVPFQISCGTCPICKSQNSQSCDTVPPGSNFGLRSASINGIFGTAAIFWTQDLPIPYLDLYNSGVQINIGRVRSREWIPKILNLVVQKIYNPGLVVTRKVSWKEAPEALLEEEPKLVVVADF